MFEGIPLYEWISIETIFLFFKKSEKGRESKETSMSKADIKFGPFFLQVCPCNFFYMTSLSVLLILLILYNKFCSYYFYYMTSLPI